MAATVENPPNVDVVPPVETDADGQQHAGGFIIRPNFQQKYKSSHHDKPIVNPLQIQTTPSPRTDSLCPSL